METQGVVNTVVTFRGSGVFSSVTSCGQVRWARWQVFGPVTPSQVDPYCGTLCGDAGRDGRNGPLRGAGALDSATTSCSWSRWDDVRTFGRRMFVGKAGPAVGRLVATRDVVEAKASFGAANVDQLDASGGGVRHTGIQDLLRGGDGSLVEPHCPGSRGDVRHQRRELRSTEHGSDDSR